VKGPRTRALIVLEFDVPPGHEARHLP
jgi:hypothetical protein